VKPEGNAPDPGSHLLAWRLTAGVALIFLVVGLAIWLRDAALFRDAEKRYDRQRAEWDLQLRADRTDAALQRTVREADRAWRSRYFQHQRFQERGWLILAITGAIAVLALHRGVRPSGPTVPAAASCPQGEADFFYRHRRILFLALLIFAGLLTAQALWNAMRGARFERSLTAAMAAATDTGRPASGGEPASHPVIWGGFRGTDGTGQGISSRIPTAWDGTRGESVTWTSPIVLPGNSSPIIAGNRVILTGATRTEHAVWACDLATGRELWRWRRPAQPVQPETVLEETGFAAPTPATDGRVVAAIFADGDLVGLDLDGRELWRRALGVPDNMYGHASSLVFAGGHLIVQWDQGRAEEGRSRLWALEPRSGRTKWETVRPVNASWATPAVLRGTDGDQVVVSASPWIIAYAAETGRELWRAGELRGDVAPSPVLGAGRVYALNTGSPLLAIRLGGTGDVTATHIDWSVSADLPDTCSPLWVSNRIFTLVSWGILTARDAETGQTIWEEDLGMTFTASPLTAGGRLVLTATDGLTVLAEVGDTYRELARNPLGDPVHASPVLGDGWILFRGKTSMWRIDD